MFTYNCLKRARPKRSDTQPEPRCTSMALVLVKCYTPLDGPSEETADRVKIKRASLACLWYMVSGRVENDT